MESRIHLHVSFPINNQSKVDVKIHGVSARTIAHAAQLNRDSCGISYAVVVGAYIDVCNVIDAVPNFDDVAVTNGVVTVANVWRSQLSERQAIR